MDDRIDIRFNGGERSAAVEDLEAELKAEGFDVIQVSYANGMFVGLAVGLGSNLVYDVAKTIVLRIVADIEKRHPKEVILLHPPVDQTWWGSE